MCWTCRPAVFRCCSCQAFLARSPGGRLAPPLAVPAVTPKAGFLSAFFAAFAYFLLADALPNGQSLGKRLLSIAVVDRKTRKSCTVSQALTRNSGALVVIDWVWIFMESRTRLGDMFAKTIVVQTGNLTSVRSLADIYDNGRG